MSLGQVQGYPEPTRPVGPIHTGVNHMGMDAWVCQDCGMRWYDSHGARHTHRNCKVLKFYVHYTRDGIQCWPQYVFQVRRRAIRGPDSRRLVVLAGDPDLAKLNGVQIRALIDVVLRKPDAHKVARRAVFYDSHRWASAHRTNRAPIVFKLDLP